MKEYEIHPAANKYPMMTGLAWEAFLEDFAENGQLEPVKIYDNKILDGRHRQKAAKELSKKLKIERIELTEDQTPEQYVDSANLHRRHLDKEKRDAMILELRAKGASQRTISQKLGVPKSTVADVVSGARNRTPEAPARKRAAEEPESIVGRDGKKYAEKKPEPEEPDESEPPTALSKALDDFIAMREILTQMNAMKALILKYAEKKNPYILNQAVESRFAEMRHDLTGAQPYALCPKCDGKGCKACSTVGWVTKFRLRQIPK